MRRRRARAAPHAAGQRREEGAAAACEEACATGTGGRASARVPSSNRRGESAASGLAKQRVIEPVLIVARRFDGRQELAPHMRGIRRKREGFAQRVGMAPGEGPDARLVLLVEYRAGDVEQLAAA